MPTNTKPINYNLKFIYNLQCNFRSILFILNLVAHPSTAVLKRPHTLGLYATRQFYISSKVHDDDVDVQLGVWHVLPNYIAKKFSTQLNLNEVIIEFK